MHRDPKKAPGTLFLCDAMLGNVGRTLRSAGYDTLIDSGKLTDRELLVQAEREGRLFLTCDRQIEKIKSSQGRVAYLPNNDMRAWAKFLSEKYGVDWKHAPFTRCLECNEPLKELPDEHHHRLPHNIRREGQRGLYCPRCNRVYWEGSHTSRMRMRLDELSGR